jgi:microcystin-dependent protein
MSDPILGEVAIFAGNFNPSYWAFCQGQTMQIVQNSALYSLLGTMYGGDGRTTFGLPDLRGRSIVGYGSGAADRTPRNFAEYGGAEQVPLNVNQMPAHNHMAANAVTGSVTVTSTLKGLNTAASMTSPSGTVLAAQGAAIANENRVYARGTPNCSMAGGAIENTVTNNLAVATTISNAGQSAAHDNMQPWLCLCYIISLAGIYPTRD